MKLACKYHKDSNTITLHFPDKFDSINLSDGSVTAAKLASGSVTTLKIVDEAIEAVKLATASITSEKVATAAIGSSHLQDALVTTAKIANLAVDTSRLADLTITAGKLASSCVEASKIANLAVGAAAIASLAVGTAKIADAAILEAKIDNAAVTSAKIFDAAVVSAKIADLAVIEAKIGNLAVNNAKLANLAVTTAKINDLAVTNAKVSNLDAGKITTGTLIVDRTAAKCTDASADQTSAHTAANAATYTGSLILTSYTTAKCTDADADQTSANGQNLGWIIGTGGELTISSGGKLKLNTADALEIQAAGNIKVQAGGDINLYSVSGNASNINFYGWDDSLTASLRPSDAGTASLTLVPGANNTKILQIGNTSASRWADVYIHTTDQYTYAHTDTDNRVYMGLVSASNASLFQLFVNRGGTGSSLYYTGAVLYPSSHKVVDLGESSAGAFDTVNADDFVNIADFYNFDIHDDLAAINGIQGSGLIDEKTGHEVIDDNTLPLWLISKHKKDGEVREQTTNKNGDLTVGDVLRTYKQGDIMYDADSKPYLSLKACVSLSWGAIRQLDKKIEKLKEQK